VRTRHWSNRVSPTLAALEEAAVDGWRTVCRNAERIKTVCRYDYLEPGPEFLGAGSVLTGGCVLRSYGVTTSGLSAGTAFRLNVPLPCGRITSTSALAVAPRPKWAMASCPEQYP
jgi:hypothetical protein